MNNGPYEGVRSRHSWRWSSQQQREELVTWLEEEGADMIRCGEDAEFARRLLGLVQFLRADMHLRAKKDARRREERNGG